MYFAITYLTVVNGLKDWLQKKEKERKTLYFECFFPVGLVQSSAPGKATSLFKRQNLSVYAQICVSYGRKVLYDRPMA